MRCRRFPPTPESPRRNRFTRRFQLPHVRPHRKLTTAPPFRKSQRPLSLHYPNHHPILKSLFFSDFDSAALSAPQPCVLTWNNYREIPYQGCPEDQPPT